MARRAMLAARLRAAWRRLRHAWPAPTPAGARPQSVVSRVLRLVRVAGSAYTIDTHAEEYRAILADGDLGEGEAGHVKA
jgi:hypothetical protein